MTLEIGHIQALYRYPVKSMAGEQLDTANLGWHGLDGDRRFAFRRIQDQSGFPWLTASRLPDLILYKPVRLPESANDVLPTHVSTPDGRLLALDSVELRDEIARRFGAEVQLMHLRQGIFDESPISIITVATTRTITDESGVPADIRRFRPNIVIRTHGDEPFSEDQWVGKVLVLGSEENSPCVNVALRDERCMMVNLNPETARSDAAMMKTVVRLNQNYAGVYGTVIRTGLLMVGQKIFLRAMA